jgi:diguanylate cyclase (GGDEF)-like protein/PAS domain S-box-containing protein
VVTRDRSRVLYVGPLCEQLYGTTPRKLRAKPQAWVAAVHPEDRARVETAVRDQGDAQLALEYRITQSDGSTRPLVHRSSPLRNARGTLTHFVDFLGHEHEVGVIAEGNREEEYRRIFFSSPDFICVTDTDGRILDANPAFLGRLGLSLEAEGIANIGSFYVGRSRRWLLRVLSKLKRGEELMGLEARVRTLQGDELHVEVDAAPLRQRDVVTRFLVLARDVTDRKAAEAALARKTREQDRLLETAHQLASSLDAKSVLARIAAQARSILNGRACVLYLLEPDGRTLTPAVSTDAPHSDKVLSTPLDIDHSLTGQAVKARGGLIFNDAWTNPAAYQVPGTPEEKEERVIVVPLAVDDKALGAMCVNRIGEMFSEEDLVLAEAFGAYAATALRNAQSHEAVRREADTRRRAEAALAREREYYRSFVESLADWAWEMDKHGVHTYCNRAVENVLGYPVEDVVGHHVTKLWCDCDNTPKNRRWLRRTLASGRGWRAFRARFRHRDGSVRLLESTALPIYDADKRLAGYRGLDHDITERVQAEEALRSSEEKFRRLVENANDILYSLDPEGTVTYVSPGARILGYTPQEIIGQNIMGLVPEKELDRVRQNFRRAVAGESGYFESPVRSKDGRVRYMRSTIQQVVDGKKVIGLQGVATDITELKRAGDALDRARRKLEDLHVITQRLEGCPSEDEVCRIAVGAAEKILESYLCCCRLAEGDQLATKARSERQTARMFWDTLVDEKLAQRTYRTCKTFRFADESELPVAGPSRHGLRSGLSVPIGDLGVLQVFALEPSAFGADDARLAELLAGHVAQAVRRIRLQNELKEQALRDPLTGVYNRYYINEILWREIKRSQRIDRPIAFLMVDVNGLKEINDLFGHQTGDRVLKATASLLENEVRATDTVVRYGGDEFLAILLEAAEEAEVVARRILQEVPRVSAQAGLGGFPVTVAIGISSWDPGGRVPVEQVLRHADDRMYEEKRKQQRKT